VGQIIEVYENDQKSRDIANYSSVSKKDNSSQLKTSSMYQSMSEGGGSALKSNANNQVAVVGFNSVFQEPKATEQVAFLLKEAQKSNV
jgi:hypothetical protein